jgi:acyl-coenzyme A synthetase/AMP-(fatty) acid ligase
MPSGIRFVQLLPKKRSGKNMHQVYRVKELGMDHGDIPTLEKYLEQRNTNPTF